ncbi:hypothetical protein M2169_006304 [Streptomyces sp. MJP52]|nr:hypothetical protein [Streptomyces sp. MJP52]
MAMRLRDEAGEGSGGTDGGNGEPQWPAPRGLRLVVEPIGRPYELSRRRQYVPAERRQRHRPRRPVQQLLAQALLQRGDAATHDGLAVRAAAYDPLDTAPWDFYVLPRSVVASLNANSVSLGTVRWAAGAPVPFASLYDRIRSAGPGPGTTGG